MLSHVWPGDVIVITYRNDRAKAVADLESEVKGGSTRGIEKRTFWAVVCLNAREIGPILAALWRSDLRLDVTNCEVLSLDSGVATCSVDGSEHPVVFITVRVTGKREPINLAVRNPFRLQEDLDAVIKASTVLNGGEFVPED